MEILKNYDLTNYNTFGLQAKAKFFCSVNSVNQLIEVLQSPEAQSHQIFPLGGGSNILLTKNIDGFVIHNNILGIRLLHQSEDHYFVEAGAGENWHQFVNSSLQNNWYGAENLSLIPGSVGAAPMQNIGAYGVELKEVFEYLDAVEISTGKIERFTNTQCEFGYRSSVFKTSLKSKYIIVKVVFKLNKFATLKTQYGAIKEQLLSMGIENPTPKDVSDAVIAIRTSKLPDPKKIGNSGSFFKNPVISTSQLKNIQSNYPEVPFYQAGDELVKVPAGWLIEQAGWKGKTINNNYGVHKFQALVLVNYGGATGKQIAELSKEIQEDIFKKFGVVLEAEVNII